MYRILNLESLGIKETHIEWRLDDGSHLVFPEDNSDRNYIRFLQALEKENDPYFLAWVEAGNNPDEFWAQPLN